MHKLMQVFTSFNSNIGRNILMQNVYVCVVKNTSQLPVERLVHSLRHLKLVVIRGGSSFDGVIYELAKGTNY